MQGRLKGIEAVMDKLIDDFFTEEALREANVLRLKGQYKAVKKDYDILENEVAQGMKHLAKKNKATMKQLKTGYESVTDLMKNLRKALKDLKKLESELDANADEIMKLDNELYEKDFLFDRKSIIERLTKSIKQELKKNTKKREVKCKGTVSGLSKEEIDKLMEEFLKESNEWLGKIENETKKN